MYKLFLINSKNYVFIDLILGYADININSNYIY